MKTEKRILKWLVTILCFSFLITFPLSSTAHAKGKIKLSSKSATLPVGKKKQLTLKNAKAKNIKWSSSDKKIATVSKKGVVKAKSAGTVTISAKYKGKTYACRVKVKDTPLYYPNGDENGYNGYKTFWVWCGCGTMFCTYEDLNWHYATMAMQGRIHGHSASGIDSSYYCRSVENGKIVRNYCGPLKPMLKYSELTLYEGSGVKLNLLGRSKKGHVHMILCGKWKTAYGVNPTWTSSNPSVVQLESSDKGNCHALKTGTSTITMKLTNGTQLSLKINVIPMPDKNITLHVGESYPITPQTNLPIFSLYLEDDKTTSDKATDIGELTDYNGHSSVFTAKKAGKARVMIDCFEDLGEAAWNITVLP